MKTSIALTAVAALAAKVSADCFSTKLGYPCCSSPNAEVLYTDNDGKWSVENNNWCGIPEATSSASCWATTLGYPC
eukprot:jgi/Orpsp1_1/1186858/evm.model.d7180000053682.1